jgi:hypothetical protein
LFQASHSMTSETRNTPQRMERRMSVIRRSFLCLCRLFQEERSQGHQAR